MSKIDAVRMVREIRDRQYAETKGKTRREVEKYYKEKAKWAFGKVAQETGAVQR